MKGETKNELLHDSKVISFTENKVALTDQMNTLINEVMQQSHSSEAQSFSPNKEQQPNRGKRKNNNEDRSTSKGTGTDGDATTQKMKKKKVSGTEKPRKQTKAKSSSDKETEKENSLGANGISRGEQASTQHKKEMQKKSSKKEKEIAKSHAADEAARQFFKVNSDGWSPNVPSAFPNAENRNDILPLLPLSPTTNVPAADRPMLALQAAIQANSTSQSPLSPLSLTPLTSVGLKYSSFTPQPFNSGDASMLNLLGNSSFAGNLTSLHSPEHSLQESTSPSTVGSLLSQSIAIINQPNHSVSEHTSPISNFQDADHDIEIVKSRQDSHCSNCRVLEEKVRKLEKMLESLSK